MNGTQNVYAIPGLALHLNAVLFPNISLAYLTGENRGGTLLEIVGLYFELGQKLV